MQFSFEDVEVDTIRFELRRGGEPVRVEPQVFEVLTYLIEHRQRLVPRAELMDAVWGDRFVSDAAVSSRIKAARSAIGDDGTAQRFIRTVHGRGVQFIGTVVADESPTPVDAPRPELDQRVRFVESTDGVSLATATVGDGPPLVKAANWLTHVEWDWQSPVWRHWNTELGRRFTYVRYDARGCGLSDHDLRGVDLSDVAVWTDDLAAVVDDSGFERFALLGMSQGGAPAIAYAAAHPERVSHLILYGSYSRGARCRGPEQAEQWDAMREMMRVGWGGTNAAFRSVFTLTMMPEASSEQIRWFNELQERTTNVDNALQLESAFYDHDLTELALNVRVPTLVMHSIGDAASPYDEGRRLARLIPDAEFVTLDSKNHVLTADEPAWPEFLRQLDRFAGEDS